MKKKSLIITIVLMMVTILGSGVLGATIYKTVTATIMPDIKVVVDGQKQILKDANGNIVNPVVINGTTYIPIRPVGDAIGKGIVWDNDTKTVYIGPSDETKTPLNKLGTILKRVGGGYNTDVDIVTDKFKIDAVGEVATDLIFNNALTVTMENTLDLYTIYESNIPYSSISFKAVSNIVGHEAFYEVYGYTNDDSKILISKGYITNGGSDIITQSFQSCKKFEVKLGTNEGYDEKDLDANGARGKIALVDVQFGN